MSNPALYDSQIRKYAYCSEAQVFREFESSPQGLQSKQVETMRERYGANRFEKRRNSALRSIRAVVCYPSSGQ